MINYWVQFDQTLQRWSRIPVDLLLFLLRCWVAWVFLKAGILKFQSWETTLMLFEYEYAVPLLSPTLAAILATLAELVLPPLVILGMLARPAALSLFFVNIVAVVSYPDISIAGVKDHYLWGMALLWVVVLGAGRFSTDYWLSRWVQKRA